MEHLAYLTAIYWLGVENHSGQWSKGYRLSCLADMRARREHSALNLGRIMEQLQNNKLYEKDSKFRSRVAYYLHHLRKYRREL